MLRRVMITGGAGFIGSALTRHLIRNTASKILVVDKLTYAGNMHSLAPVLGHPRLEFAKMDICDGAALRRLLNDFRPDIVMHLAAESHVDRSIDGPTAFVNTNVVGTFTLLEATLGYCRRHPDAGFRFHHVSTDEVFGSLGGSGAFGEGQPYNPRSPYAASKAASDHLVRAWHYTFGLPVLITNCSNNYGPYQFPEKLIPLTILNALNGEALPVYGNGENIRDWLFVEDHVDALVRVAERGLTGETYCIGGSSERSNLEVVTAVCSILDKVHPASSPHSRLIEFVSDRPGHDFRYAIDISKIRGELGWSPKTGFEIGLERTVRWYLDNKEWWEGIRSGVYGGERLGAVA